MTRARDLADIISGGFTEADIPALSASKITSGSFADGRIPNLAASKITSGAFDAGRLTNAPSGGGHSRASVASSGNVTLNLSGDDNYFDAGTLTGTTAITFGTPSSANKRFIYTFIPSYNTSASSVDDTSTWVIDGTQHDNTVETAGICKIFSNDGLKFYVLTYNGDQINEFTLSAPFQFDNMVWSHRVYLNGETSSQVGPVVKNSISASLAIPECMRFNPNGTKLFVLGRSSDAIKEFHLSTAFDLSTISLDSSFSVGSNETNPMNFTFNNDGTKLYVAGTTGDGIDQYNLSTGYDVSTASFFRFDSMSSLIDASGVATVGGLMFWNSDGTKMFFGPSNSASSCIYTLIPNSPYIIHSTTQVDQNNIFRFGFNAHIPGGGPVWTPMPTLDRIHWSDQNIVIERGTRYIPTFSTAFSGAFNFFTRGYRHFLEFETHDTGSSYQLINHTKTNIQ